MAIEGWSSMMLTHKQYTGMSYENRIQYLEDAASVGLATVIDGVLQVLVYDAREQKEFIAASFGLSNGKLEAFNEWQWTLIAKAFGVAAS